MKMVIKIKKILRVKNMNRFVLCMICRILNKLIKEFLLLYKKNNIIIM